VRALLIGARGLEIPRCDQMGWHRLPNSHPHSIKGPEYRLDRIDSGEMGKKILSVSYSGWKKMGNSKGTLHYTKRNARGERPFRANGMVMAHLT
jgi:CRISPR-associated protein Cas1